MSYDDTKIANETSAYRRNTISRLKADGHKMWVPKNQYSGCFTFMLPERLKEAGYRPWEVDIDARCKRGSYHTLVPCYQLTTYEPKRSRWGDRKVRTFRNKKSFEKALEKFAEDFKDYVKRCREHLDGEKSEAQKLKDWRYNLAHKLSNDYLHCPVQWQEHDRHHTAFKFKRQDRDCSIILSNHGGLRTDCHAMVFGDLEDVLAVFS